MKSYRLISAIYSGAHPFHLLEGVNDVVVIDDIAFPFQPGDILIVWGGADISPALYKKGRSSMGNGSPVPCHRDIIEWGLMQNAKENKIPIIGVCRGAQMLCALEGGHLIQHVDNHGGTHLVHTDLGDFHTNSIHHQMMVPVGTYELLAWTDTRSGRYFDVDDQGEDVILGSHPENKDPEYIFYPEIKGFAIQWHPEMMPAGTAATQYLLTHIQKNV